MLHSSFQEILDRHLQQQPHKDGCDWSHTVYHLMWGRTLTASSGVSPYKVLSDRRATYLAMALLSQTAPWGVLRVGTCTRRWVTFSSSHLALMRAQGLALGITFACSKARILSCFWDSKGSWTSSIYLSIWIPRQVLCGLVSLPEFEVGIQLNFDASIFGCDQGLVCIFVDLWRVQGKSHCWKAFLNSEEIHKYHVSCIWDAVGDARLESAAEVTPWNALQSGDDQTPAA